MGYICDFCGDQPSMVYCHSDAACLCLPCDRNVHSANALSKRHSRTLLCERCNSQPAFVRCAEEKVSLCQNCDWMGHDVSTSNSTHKRQTINCYSGCPSTCEQELGLMSISENIESTSWGPKENTICQNSSDVAEVNCDHNLDMGNGWGGTSIPEIRSAAQLMDRPAGSTDMPLPKLFCPQTKCPGPGEDDLYGGMATGRVGAGFWLPQTCPDLLLLKPEPVPPRE